MSRKLKKDVGFFGAVAAVVAFVIVVISASLIPAPAPATPRAPVQPLDPYMFIDAKMSDEDLAKFRALGKHRSVNELLGAIHRTFPDLVIVVLPSLNPNSNTQPPTITWRDSRVSNDAQKTYSHVFRAKQMDGEFIPAHTDVVHFAEPSARPLREYNLLFARENVGRDVIFHELAHALLYPTHTTRRNIKNWFDYNQKWAELHELVQELKGNNAHPRRHEYPARVVEFLSHATKVEQAVKGEEFAVTQILAYNRVALGLTSEQVHRQLDYGYRNLADLIRLFDNAFRDLMKNEIDFGDPSAFQEAPDYRAFSERLRQGVNDVFSVKESVPYKNFVARGKHLAERELRVLEHRSCEALFTNGN